MNDSQYLQHYGIGGMKWGQRRFQNTDGSLTPAGRERYGRVENGKFNLGLKRLAGRINSGTDRINARYGPKAATQQKPEPPKAERSVDDIIRGGKASEIMANQGRMSTAELKAANDRLRELSTLRDYTVKEAASRQPGKMEKGKKLAMDILGPVAKDQAKKLATAGAVIIGKKIVENAFQESSPYRKPLLKALGSDPAAEAEEKRKKSVNAVIRSSDIDAILKNSKNMTSNELEEAKKRIANEEALRLLREKMGKK